MKTTSAWREMLTSGACDRALAHLYGVEEVFAQRERYLARLAAFERVFDGRPALLVSAPGRSEIGGNHTDHQRGRVIAASVSLDMLAVAAKNSEGLVRIHSEGYPVLKLRIDQLDARKRERNTSRALVRGVLAGLRRRGVRLGGFDASVDSLVPKGSGLSSSAAYSILIGNIASELYASGRFTPVELAQTAQFAENQYFGKPSGLMDQLACSVGGFAQVDFFDAARPAITRIDCDFAAMGLTVFLQNAGGSHAGLTPEYAAIPADMGRVAACFGKPVLSEVETAEFFARLGDLRGDVPDRALLRAIHFFEENARVPEQAAALRAGDAERFCALARASGRSSFMQLQNVCPTNAGERSMALALAVSERLLRGRGAVRVHGGGFAGAVQAFVPDALAEEYQSGMERVFGEGSCYRLRIRPVGGYTLPECGDTI